MLARVGYCLLVLAVAQSTSADPLFEDTAVVDITLAGPVKTLLKNRDSGFSLPFEIELDERKIPVSVSLRGKSRLEYCRFPPLLLDFGNSAVPANSVFAGQDQLKLVTHCVSRNRAAPYVFNEYLAYRILSVLSEFSLRVRLLRINYIDTENRSEPSLVRFAFAIEENP